MEPTYPFTPKSNRYLKAGQFWAVPLSDGRFAAGRVTVVPAFGPKDHIGVVVALMDWVGVVPPTSDDLIGRQLVTVQAQTNYRAISRTGGNVLGERALELDGIIPIDPTDFRVGAISHVWGWAGICQHAERQFVGPNSKSVCWSPGDPVSSMA